MHKRNALVTGGARGIGAATAKALATAGYRVFINYLSSEETANGLADEINGSGGEAYVIRGDVRDGSQIEAMFGEIEKRGGVDILVCNANMNFTSKPFLEQSWDEFAQKLNDEMHAAFMTAKHAAASMVKRNYGRLIFISSTLGDIPAPNFIAHGSAKASLDTFSKYLALELGPMGITSNIIAPGLVLTDATENAPDEFKEHIRRSTPTQKISMPDHVASVAAFLASEESAQITGAYIPVCGGAHMP